MAADTDALVRRVRARGRRRRRSSPPARPGGNGAIDVIFHAISADGTRVFFETDEQLVAGRHRHARPTSTSARAGRRRLVSTGPPAGNGAVLRRVRGSLRRRHPRRSSRPTSSSSRPTPTRFYDVYQRAGRHHHAGLHRARRAATATSTPATATSRPTAPTSSSRPQERSSAADTDAQTDVYERSGGTTTLLSTGPPAATAPSPATFEGSSSRRHPCLLQHHASRSRPATPTRAADIYRRAGRHDRARVRRDRAAATARSTPTSWERRWTARRVRPHRGIPGGDGHRHRLCGRPGPPVPGRVRVHRRRPRAWSPPARPAATGRSMRRSRRVSLDGQRVFFDTREPLTAERHRRLVDVYERFGGITTHISIGPAGGNGAFTAFLFSNGLSDDGTRAFFDTRESLMTSDTDTVVRHLRRRRRRVSAAEGRLARCGCRWCRPTASARRRTARTDRRSASASCNPAGGATSSQATIGTPDANGGGANFVGLRPLRGRSSGRPGCAEDSDVTITSSLHDVRCRPAGASCGAANAAGPADYTGELRATVALRMTDRWNGGRGRWRHGCGHRPERLAGPELPVRPDRLHERSARPARSRTSANAIVPGLVLDTKRAIWQLDQVQVYDGGAGRRRRHHRRQHAVRGAGHLRSIAVGLAAGAGPADDRAARRGRAWSRCSVPRSATRCRSTCGVELADAFTRLAGDDSVACIVLTGAGTAFCSGMDTAQFGGDLGAPPPARGDEHRRLPCRGPLSQAGASRRSTAPRSRAGSRSRCCATCGSPRSRRPSATQRCAIGIPRELRGRARGAQPGGRAGPVPHRPGGRRPPRRRGSAS